MPKISPSQLRAARGLLNWSQTDLSKTSGISEPTIYRFENGMNEPETRTENKLLKVFDERGVEFSEHQGVRFKPSNIDVYDGVERFNDYYDFLDEHLEKFGGDVCVNVYDETYFQHFRKDSMIHVRRMKKLFDQRKITFRILTTISTFITGGYAVHRWIPKQPPSPTGFYAFGDCLALVSFADPSSPHIVVIRSKPMAEGYRQSFNLAWQLGQKPPHESEIIKLLSGNPEALKRYYRISKNLSATSKTLDE